MLIQYYSCHNVLAHNGMPVIRKSIRRELKTSYLNVLCAQADQSRDYNLGFETSRYLPNVMK